MCAAWLWRTDSGFELRERRVLDGARELVSRGSHPCHTVHCDCQAYNAEPVQVAAHHRQYLLQGIECVCAAK